MSAVLQSATVAVNPALAKAVEILGSQKALSDVLGVSPQTAHQLFYGAGLHERHCPAIERATGEQVKCEELRPDLHWVRGDHDEILGFITPADNATPQYIRASMMARAREQAKFAAQATSDLHNAVHFAQFETEESSLAYLRGCTHGLSDEVRAEIEARHCPQGVTACVREFDATKFQELADGIVESARDERSGYDLEYGQAYGIMHCLGASMDSDSVKEQLIQKHGFGAEGTPDPIGRLNALYADVQEIVRSHRVEAREATAAVPGPKSRLELSFTSTCDSGRIHSNWYVLRDLNRYRGDGVRIGEMYFDEVLQLAAHDPVEAFHAILYAPQSAEWHNGNGQEHGFMGRLARYAMAAALAFPSGIPTEFDAKRMDDEADARECAESIARDNRRARRAATKQQASKA